MANANLDYIRRFKWIYGMPPYDFWLKNQELIRVIVKEHKLKPVAQNYFPDQIPMEFEGELRETKARKRVIDKKLWPGGIRIAHVHLNRDIYIFKDAQWNQLVSAKMGEFKEKMEKVQTVDFAQLMKLSEAMDALPG